MFGWFKKKMAPEGPVDFALDMEIARPAADIYRLLDWSDDMNAKRAEGQQVLAGAGIGQWRLIMQGMEDVTFHLNVTQEERDRLYGYTCQADPMIGRLVSSHEVFRIEPLPDGTSKVYLHVTAQFIDGMTEKEFARETALMSLGCHSSLARLKIHAEHGPDAARDAQIVAMD